MLVLGARDTEAFFILLKHTDRRRLLLSIVLPRSMAIVAKNSNRMWSTDSNIYPLMQSMGLAAGCPGLDTWKAFQCDYFAKIYFKQKLDRFNDMQKSIRIRNLFTEGK